MCCGQPCLDMTQQNAVCSSLSEALSAAALITSRQLFVFRIPARRRTLIMTPNQVRNLLEICCFVHNYKMLDVEKRSQNEHFNSNGNAKKTKKLFLPASLFFIQLTKYCIALRKDMYLCTAAQIHCC